MNPVSIPCLIMAAITFYVGASHLLIYLRRPQVREYLPFALLCFSIGAYDIFCTGLYNSYSVQQGIVWQRLQLNCLAPITLSLTWFIIRLTNNPLRLFPRILVIIFAALFALTFLPFPALTLDPAQPAIKYIRLASWLNVTYYEATTGLLYAIGSIMSVIGYIYLLILVFRKYRATRQSSYLVIFIAQLAYFVGVENDFMVSFRMIEFIYLSEYCFFLVLLSMAYVLLVRFVDLHRAVEDLNVNLERKVEERTRQLSDSQKNISDIMNNIESGLITFDRHLSLSSEHSRAAEQLFATTDFTQTSLADLFCLDTPRLQSFMKWTNFAFSSKMGQRNWAKTVRLCPLCEVCRTDPGQTRFLKLDFQPIYIQERIARIMVIVNDITAVKKAEASYKKLQQEKELQLERVYALVENRADTIISLINDGQSLLDRLSHTTPEVLAVDTEIRRTVFRDTHTLKGTSGSMGFVYLPSLLQKLESLYDEIRAANHTTAEFARSLHSARSDLSSELEVIASLRRRLFFQRENHISVDIDNYNAVVAKAAGGAYGSGRELIRDLIDLNTVSTRVFCQKYNNMIDAYCTRTGKKIDPIVLAPDTVKIPLGVAALLDRPFTHLIRNSIDHGIEASAVRLALGKPLSGTLTLSTARAEDSFVITLQDDGCGLDPQLIADKAVKKGFLSTDAAKKMSLQEKLELILLHGFSTCEAMTEISGRGVGMDAVKTEIEKAGGSLALTSAPGKCTCITITLPFHYTAPAKASDLQSPFYQVIHPLR